MIVKQLDIFLTMIELFRQQRCPMTLTQLSCELKQAKSSTHNLIETLRVRGYLYEVAHRGGFYPSRRLLEVMNDIAKGDPLIDWLHPHLASLAQETQETALLGALDGKTLIYLDAVESHLPVRYFASAGQRRPLYATSGGKALLSAMKQAELQAILRQLDFHDRTDRSIDTIERLLEDIEAGRKRGWFTNRSEYTSDVTGIGVPFNIDGRSLALSVAGPNYRLDGRHTEIAAAVTAMARKIELSFHRKQDETISI